MTEKKNTFTDKLILYTGVLSSLTGIASNLIEIINSNMSKTLLVIGVAFVLLYFLVKQWKKNKIKSIFFILYSVITIIISTLICLNLYGLLNKKKEKCLFGDNFISIGISKFDDSNENFSSLAYEFLKEENLADSIYKIRKIEKNFFNKIPDSSFTKTLDSLCLKKGLIISGKHNSEEKLFYCKIKIRDLYNKKDSILVNKLVTFRNPNLHQFSMDSQAQILVDFVLAIISFSEMNLEKSEELFSNCIRKNKNKSNKHFLSDCNIFLGDIHSINNQEEKALNSYLEAFNLKENDNLLVPIINTYINQKKLKKAKEYVEKIKDKRKFDILNIRKRLKLLELEYKKTAVSKSTTKKIIVPPQGSFKIQGTTINYISVTTYNYKERDFFIYKTVENNFGVFDSYGRLIRMPDFKNIIEAKDFIKKITD